MSETTLSAQLNAKSQLTLPVAVREALDVAPGDEVVFTIREEGAVELAKAGDVEVDLVVEAYLAFLEKDMRQRPGSISVVTRDEAIGDLLSDIETEDFDLGR